MMRRLSQPIAGDRSRSAAHAVGGALLSAVVGASNLLGAPGPVGGPTPVPLPPIQAAPAAPLPEPIYWKQHLFLIPYQWGSAAEPGAARAVWLFVSKDRGASWQKISEAKPDVKAFNYRAEGDGEYWFAVRTFDKQGRAWPQGSYQPELRVVVDTTLPRIDELRTQPAANGAIEIQSRVADSNLDPNTWKFEWQADANGPWQPAALQSATVQPIGNTGLPLGGSMLHAFWQPPAGTRPIAIRGIVMDRAGNSATYLARLDGGPGTPGPLLTSPAVSPAVPNQPVAAAQAPLPASQPPALSPPTFPSTPLLPPANALQATGAAQGWTSAGSAPATTANTPSAQPAPATASGIQPWPAANSGLAPFQLWTGNTTTMKDDGVTAYGNPPLFSPPPASNSSPRSESTYDGPRVEARFAGISKTPAKPAPPSVNPASPPTVPDAAINPQFATLEPYRESANGANDTPPIASAPVASSMSITGDVTPIGSRPSLNTPPSPPKLVGSRTFALEYDLDNAGRGGVSKVELWGTRDGGKNWNRYTQDNDNRSPLVVTVDEEGIYGFRIVVQMAGGAAAEVPRAGDSPELWVSVDLKRPVVELTSIERGQGNIADHLILRWQAVDNNLEPRPIGLFYSSRPSGPWSAIATNLQNTGEYAWRVERYVPARFYLRVEARDTAGNLAAFQTREPVEFSTARLSGRLRSAESPESAVAHGPDSYR